MKNLPMSLQYVPWCNPSVILSLKTVAGFASTDIGVALEALIYLKKWVFGDSSSQNLLCRLL